jgi:tetratricopeptide (TPR) repeat protein
MKNRWNITGLVATLIIVIIIPLQVIKYHITRQEGLDDFPAYMGTSSCIECHQMEYDLWKDSDHDRAMDVATDQTVLGDFNDAILEYRGFENRFFKKNGKFFVYTQGEGGEPAEFEITYTFGVRPLQQYLVEFPGGHIQCLPITWDTEKKQWYHLAEMVYPDEELPPDDWLYWTNYGQNWNGMCADCHSTDLHKNLDPVAMEYNTTWSDIDVGCEACHGPGSAHLDWAKLPEGERPMNVNTGLIVKTSDINNREYVDNCARCHSRRSALSDYDHRSEEFLDYNLPQVSIAPVYFVDGQILEENYVYGSFLQSKMFMKGVRCSDCHNAHSLEFIQGGNGLCLQCHRADQYDTYSHHFHKMNGREHRPQEFNSPPQYIEGEGARCINCHMDGRYYMGVDFRRDHSFRNPRPDLTLSLGVPNACNSCHKDKSAQWSQEYIVKWYGLSRPVHSGTVIASGNTGDTAVLNELAAIVSDELQAPMVRTAAIHTLSNYSGLDVGRVLKPVLGHTDPLIRLYAAKSFNPVSIQDMKDTYLQLLHDPIKPVRMEAAYLLSQIYGEIRDSLQRKALDNGIREYEQSMKYTGDFAASRHNLGNLYRNLGRLEEAKKEYRMALMIDDQFYPAKVNLANVFNALGQNDKAEILLRDVLEKHPEVPGINYSLGLLLAEVQKFDEALKFLEKATTENPTNGRIFYNYGLLLNQTGDKRNAEKALLNAYRLEPENSGFIYAISTFYIENRNKDKAMEYALLLQQLNPGDASVQQFVDQVMEFNP